MFDFGWAELLIIAAIALFVIGPQDIPKIAYQIGKAVRRVKYMQYALTGQFDDFMAKVEAKENPKQKHTDDHDDLDAADIDEAAADEELLNMIPLPPEGEDSNHGGTEARREIIPLSEDYLESAIDLIQSAFPENEYTDLPARFLQAVITPAIADNYKDMASLNNRQCWIIVDDDKVIGLIGLMDNSLDEDNSSWVSWLCVDQYHQKCGLGHALLSYVESVSVEKEKSVLKLWVHKNNAKLHKYYENFGFNMSKEKVRVDGDLTMSKPLRLRASVVEKNEGFVE